MLNQVLKIFSISFILILLFSCDQPKIGYVESDRLLAEFGETKIAAKKLEENTFLLRSRFDTLKAEFDKMQEDFTKDLSSMSNDERGMREKQMSKKQNDLNRYYKNMSDKIREEDLKMTNKLVKRIDRVVKKYGDEHGFTLILGATSQGNIVYADKSINLTDEVIKLLNNH